MRRGRTCRVAYGRLLAARLDQQADLLDLVLLQHIHDVEDRLVAHILVGGDHHVAGCGDSRAAAEAAAAAPHLGDPEVISTPPGSHPVATASDVDLYAYTHNETSTGVAMPLRRPANSGDAIVAVDATSAAGGIMWDPTEVDVYYFAPQKCFAADGDAILLVGRDAEKLTAVANDLRARGDRKSVV